MDLSLMKDTKLIVNFNYLLIICLTLLFKLCFSDWFCVSTIEHVLNLHRLDKQL